MLSQQLISSTYYHLLFLHTFSEFVRCSNTNTEISLCSTPRSCAYVSIDMHYMAEMASKYASCTLNSGMYNKFVCAYMYIYMYIYLFVSVPAFL